MTTLSHAPIADGEPVMFNDAHAHMERPSEPIDHHDLVLQPRDVTFDWSTTPVEPRLVLEVAQTRLIVRDARSQVQATVR